MQPKSISILILASAAMLRAQPVSALPSWLENYPGATPSVRASAAMLESSYTVEKAQLDDVVAHYQKVFDAAKLPIQANPDGIGTTIRASAPECDLLIQLRERSNGIFVDTFCSPPSKNPAGEAVTSSATKQTPATRQNPTATVIRPQPARVGASPVPGSAPQIPPELLERQKRLAAEMGIGRQHPDAPAPPLVWPSWLTHVRGEPLHSQKGLNYAKDDMLSARYTTNVPMTEIHDFYRDLLKAHEYQGSNSISTGQTLTGVQQNALGYVEGMNYPDGAPGAYSTIKVSFSRDVLNGPITVILTYTTHAYIAKRGY